MSILRKFVLGILLHLKHINELNSTSRAGVDKHLKTILVTNHRRGE